MNILELLNKLRNGEKVVCDECGKGVYRSVSGTEPQTTHCFVCSSCGTKINID